MPWVVVESLAAVNGHVVIEALLVAAVVYLLVFRSKKRSDMAPGTKLTEAEKDVLIAEWTPEPLVPESTPDDDQTTLPPAKYVDGRMGKVVHIDGQEYANFGTNNFLGFVGNSRIEEIAKKTIFKYGVGSCGPRGFYGTVDVHLDLEKELASFLGCEEAVLYSFGFATIASAIPAYAKKGDVIFADKAVNFAIQKGLQASRSRIEWFEHNDVADLERLLKLQAQRDAMDPKAAANVRRFMVVEGLYGKTADLCPLNELLSLKWKYKVRIFIDESYSFGVIGKTGRGVTEHFGVDVIDIDMIMASLENGLATTGGFCAGRSYVVGHQRLSGLGYCFSASLPPLLATAASEGLRIINEEPQRLDQLRTNSKLLREGLKTAFANTKYSVVGDVVSPLQHVVYDGDNERAKLQTLHDALFDRGFMVTVARYLDKDEIFPCRPSLKITVSAEHTPDEITRLLDVLRASL